MNTSDIYPLPRYTQIEQYMLDAKDFVIAVRGGNGNAIERINRYHYISGNRLDSGKLNDNFSLGDAQQIISREYGFSAWDPFSQFIEDINQPGSSESQFESAADAVISGDKIALERLLDKNPELVRVRSKRLHQATLLHYMSANGIENYRQKSAANAIDIATILLSAGAVVDALHCPDSPHGAGTTLGLVATSIHPKLAGVQIGLLETLLEYGASIDGAPGSWNPLIAALHNGRGDAAEFLASRGSRLDLESAAGVGRLDVIKSYFNVDGSLRPGANRSQLESGFMWACEYGRNDMVRFLLEKAVDVNAGEETNLTGLHWAVVGAQTETIGLLLEHGARIEALNVYGGTALGQALWCIANSAEEIDYIPVVEKLLSAGSIIEPGTLEWLKKQETIQPEKKKRLEKIITGFGAQS